MLAANRGSLRYDVQTLQRLQEEDGMAFSPLYTADYRWLRTFARLFVSLTSEFLSGGDGGDEDLARQRAELTKQETQHMLQRQAALKNAIARSDVRFPLPSSHLPVVFGLRPVVFPWDGRV